MAAQKTTKERITFLTQFSLLLAIEALFCFTPLGSIPVPGGIVATLAAVPVIITGIVMGVKAGALMGFAAGLFSFIVWTFMAPGPMAFVFTPFYSIGDVHGNFWSLVICFVPRILVGVVAAIIYKIFSRLAKKRFWVYGLAGILGSFTNTIGVLGGIYIFFGEPYAEVMGVGYKVLLGLIAGSVLTNGIPEAIVAALVAMAVCAPLIKISTPKNVE